MSKHPSSIASKHCFKHCFKHCSEHVHGRTDVLTENYLLNVGLLTLANAREKKPPNSPPWMTPAPAGATRPAVNHA